MWALAASFRFVLILLTFDSFNHQTYSLSAVECLCLAFLKELVRVVIIARFKLPLRMSDIGLLFCGISLVTDA